MNRATNLARKFRAVRAGQAPEHYETNKPKAIRKRSREQAAVGLLKQKSAPAKEATGAFRRAFDLLRRKLGVV